MKNTFNQIGYNFGEKIFLKFKNFSRVNPFPI